MYRRVQRAMNPPPPHDPGSHRDRGAEVSRLLGLFTWPIRPWLYVTESYPDAGLQPAKVTHSAHQGERWVRAV